MKKGLKITLYIAAAALLILCIYLAAPYIKLLYTEEGRAEINNTVSGYGSFAPIILYFLYLLRLSRL